MKKPALALLAILAFAFVSSTALAAQSVDAVSKASTKSYYPALTGQALFDAIKNSRDAMKRIWACTMSTVNADGTPNAAVVIPGYADDETLMFGIAPNQTSENLKARKLAVLTLYIRDPAAPADKKDGATGKAFTDYGARIVLQFIDDPAAIAALTEKTKAAKGTIFCKIVKILPLG